MSLQCMGTARLCSSQCTGRSRLGAMSTALDCSDVLPSGQAGTESCQDFCSDGNLICTLLKFTSFKTEKVIEVGRHAWSLLFSNWSSSCSLQRQAYLCVKIPSKLCVVYSENVVIAQDVLVLYKV